MDTYITAFQSTTASVKDLALRTVASASNNDEVFIGIEDILEGYRELPNDDSQVCKDLLELINMANDKGAKMLHLT